MSKKDDCYKALQCLYIAVDKTVAEDVNNKVKAYLKELETWKEEDPRMLREPHTTSPWAAVAVIGVAFAMAWVAVTFIKNA